MNLRYDAGNGEPSRVTGRRLIWQSAAFVLVSAIAPVAGCSAPANQPTLEAPRSTPYLSGGSPSVPLGLGDRLPPLAPHGWINGPPPDLVAQNFDLMVVDLWANWCPFCRRSAPELVRVFDKYKSRRVVFVSLTNMPRESVESFVKQFSIPWPNGFGLTVEALAELGARTSISMPGYELGPTLYLVTHDGRIQWCDAQGRYRHMEPKNWGEQLEKAIEAALVNGDRARPKIQGPLD